MDVLLINPPREVPQKADFPPIGLAYIAAMLKRNNIRNQVLDASAFSWNRLEKEIKDKSPLIVGIPCWTVERGQSFKLAKLVKKVLPTAKIIVGGHHATAFPEHMFSLAYADAVVIGEGETTTVELVKTFLSNKSIHEIKGIAFQQDGQTVITGRRDYIEDLDMIPFPCYDDINLGKYLGLPEVKGISASVITSRGCPHKCIYCSASKFWEQKWRARSAGNVLDEIEWLYKDYEVKNFIFFDDNFTVKKERAIEVCQGIIERNLDINWVAESHVTHIDKELLIWMKKSGCYRIDYGVESGSAKILRNIKKGQTANRIEETFRLTHEAGIKPNAYLMVGNPGEDEKTINETIELMKKTKPCNIHSVGILWILPNTEIYELAKSKGIISDDYWLKNNSLVHFTGEHDIEELKLLKNKLMKGLVKNKGNLNAYIEYFIRYFYYKYPVLQKLRKWRRIIGL